MSFHILLPFSVAYKRHYPLRHREQRLARVGKKEPVCIIYTIKLSS